jgi:hypothetical protein
MNITQVNITLPATFTYLPSTQGVGENETVAIFTNTTTVLSWTNATAAWFLINGTEAGVVGNWTYFWFNASASEPGTYNITVTTVNGTNTTTQNISVQINDTTSPLVSFDGDTPAANSNLSLNYIIVNITADDSDGAYAGVLNNITYYISNSSGVWNTTIIHTNSDLINFTGLVDGTYYINATANDTLGNTNTTGTGIRTITLDTVAPTATAACTPASVSQNAVETCTCTSADTGTGVASASATSTPSTADTGTYYYTCSVTDYAGNSASSTTSFDVTGTGNTGSGTTGSTTTSFWTKGTETVTDEQFKNAYTKALSVRQRIKVTIENISHYVGVIGLTATTATLNISSDPQQAILIIGDERKFEVSGDEYYDISIKLNSIEDSKANVTTKSIHELITPDTIVGETELQGAGEAAKGLETASEIPNWVWWATGIIALIIVTVGIIYSRKKK